MDIANRKGVVYSLYKTFHPKCFKTTNFDGLRQGVSLLYVFQISCQIPNSDYAIDNVLVMANLKPNVRVLCFFNVWTEKKNVCQKTGDGMAFAGK